MASRELLQAVEENGGVAEALSAILSALQLRLHKPTPSPGVSNPIFYGEGLPERDIKPDMRAGRRVFSTSRPEASEDVETRDAARKARRGRSLTPYNSSNA